MNIRLHSFKKTLEFPVSTLLGGHNSFSPYFAAFFMEVLKRYVADSRGRQEIIVPVGRDTMISPPPLFAKFPNGMTEYPLFVSLARSDKYYVVTPNPELRHFYQMLQQYSQSYDLANSLILSRSYSFILYEYIYPLICDDGGVVRINLEKVRELCDCDTKYDRISQLKDRVVGAAVQEISNCTPFNISLAYSVTSNGQECVLRCSRPREKSGLTDLAAYSL